MTETTEARQSAHNDLRISEMRYRRLFEAARDGILILDAVTCKITDVNPFMVELLGYPREEFLGKELFEIGLLKDAAASQEMYRELQESGYIRYEDLPLQTKWGKRREVEFVSNVYAENGHQVIQCNIRDITDRKSAEAHLLASETSLRAAQQVAHLGSWELDLSNLSDLNSNTLRWSDEVFRIFGHQPGEIEVSNENFFGAVHPDDRARIMTGIADAIQQGKNYSIDHRILLPDGSERVVHELANIISHPSGHPLKLVGTIQDITERKRAEETSARLASIVESSEDAIISKTLDGIITTWNVGAQKLYGYTAQEVIGRPISFVAPSDLPDEMSQLLEKIRRGESVEHYETERVRKDGSRLDISLSISPLRDTDGNIIGASSVKRDITQRKLAEQQLQMHSHLLNVIGQAVIVTDPVGTITYWNDFAEKLYGWPASEVWGRNILDVTPTDTTQQKAAEILACLARGQSWVGEFIAQRRDGTTFPAYVTDTPVLDAAGHIVSIIGLSLDISERKQAEAALHESQRFLQATLNSLSSHIAVLDENGNMIAVNQSWRQFSEKNGGTPFSCGVGANYIDVCDCATGTWAEEAPEVAQAIRAVVAGQHEAFCLEYPCHSPSEERWFTVCVTRFGGEGPVRVVVAHENITTRKQAEAEEARLQVQMEEQRQRLNTIVATVPGVVWETFSQPDAASERLDFTSDYIETMLGYTVAEWIAAPNFWLTIVHPDDKEQAVRAGAAIFSGGRGGTSQYRWIAKDGHTVWVESRMVVICDEAGHPVGLRGVTMDVTERKQAEDALRASESRVSSIVNAAMDAIISMDHEGRVIEFNPAAQRIFGYEREAAIGRYVGDLIVPPELREQHCKGLARYLKTGELKVLNQRLELMGMRADGKTLPIELTITRSPLEGPPTFIGYLRDITERKQTEEALQRQQAELRVLFDLMPAMIWFKDTENNILRVNQRVAEAAGKSVAEIEGKPSLEIYPQESAMFYADDVDVIRSATPKLGIVERVRNQEGKECWNQTDKVPVCDKDGKVIGIVVMAQDITERKRVEAAMQSARDELERRVADRTSELEQANAALQEKEVEQHQVMDTLAKSEERFRLLVESVHDYAILMLDTTGHVMTWNAGAARLKGYRAEEIIGQHFSCFYSQEDQQAGKPDEELRIAEGEGYLDDEGWRVRQDGSRFWSTVVITALRDDSGHLRGFAKITRDITERKNIVAALQEAKAQADTANLAKSEFLSRMSHELRTPLNAILGFGQILEMKHPLDDSDGEGEAVEHILKGGRHLLGLINEVLDIASIEAGRSSLSPEPIPISRTVREVMDMVRPLAATRQIRIVNEVDAQDERHVRADLQRFRQILLNLLANAIKYNCDAGRVNISCEENGESLRLKVSDTGAGLTPAEQARLFMPFERLGAANSKVEGTGLGLALCKTLVEAMEGRIGVDSTPGQGSTFWVEFPLVESQIAQLERSDDRVVKPSGLQAVVPTSAPRTVLYIEDNLSNFKVIESLLRDRPEIKLLSAMQGSIGLDLARQHLPDLILLDLHLPDIPGEMVLHHLRAEPATRSIPVVVLSADATPEKIDKLRAAGIEHYLTKPINLRQFLQVLDEILKQERGGGATND